MNGVTAITNALNTTNVNLGLVLTVLGQIRTSVQNSEAIASASLNKLTSIDSKLLSVDSHLTTIANATTQLSSDYRISSFSSPTVITTAGSFQSQTYEEAAAIYAYLTGVLPDLNDLAKFTFNTAGRLLVTLAP